MTTVEYSMQKLNLYVIIILNVIMLYFLNTIGLAPYNKGVDICQFIECC